MALWVDLFRLFSYAFTDDPLSRKQQKELTGAGVSQPDAIPDIRANADGTIGSGGASIRLRDTNDFVDLSTVTNRIHRYKEYERLRNMAEIETVMTVFADEACLAGNTKVSTPHGHITLKELEDTKKNERFLVYCYDFENNDYTLGWAFNPRKTKRAMTIRVILDNGAHFICTPDHRILLQDGEWKEAGKLKDGDELMPFYRIPARQELTKIKTNQFPRIWTKNRGWIHERQFVNEWTTGQVDPKLEIINKYCRMICQGLSTRQIKQRTGNDLRTILDRMRKAGFSNSEVKWLASKSDRRKVIAVHPHEEIDVYDLSVEKHKNFATDWGIVHNCQKDDDGRAFKIETKNKAIRAELEYLFFNRKMLNLDQKRLWNVAKQTFIMGDFFWEIVIDSENPKRGVINLVPLPPDSMYRIETTKGKLIEFQQSKEGPDYQSLSRVEITQATESDLQQATAIRFAPEQIIHIRIGDDRKTFYPYGVSLIEAARGPAHQLRLMEDSMVVYRLVRAPERLMFYIDIHQLTPAKAEAFVERMKDQFKKKKVAGRTNLPGAASVEERWSAMAADENFWIPIRGNSNTRVETLPGAQNLGEIDDTVYFRNKLYVALNFPRNYFNNEDTQTTRVSVSNSNITFAKLIERLQSHLEDSLWEIADRHLKLLGHPEEDYEDLAIHLTSPSDWRDLTRAEVITNRLTNASTLKGSLLMADYDILTRWLKYSDEEAKAMLSRLKIQKLEDLKMQIIATNPTLLGVGVPGPNETEIGTDAAGPNPELGAAPQQPALPEPPQQPQQDQGKQFMSADNQGGNTITQLPEPSDEELRKFNLDIKDYSKEMDDEEIDRSETDE